MCINIYTSVKKKQAQADKMLLKLIRYFKVVQQFSTLKLTSNVILSAILIFKAPSNWISKDHIKWKTAVKSLCMCVYDLPLRRLVGRGSRLWPAATTCTAVHPGTVVRPHTATTHTAIVLITATRGPREITVRSPNRFTAAATSGTRQSRCRAASSNYFVNR